MKRVSIIVFLLVSVKITMAQIYNDTLDVVTWNLRYFGSDTSLNGQATNVKNVMNQINADIYTCQEVVNVDSFKWLANNLNGNFGYYYSYYGSGAFDTNSVNYPNSLKFGFLYRKSMVGNIKVKPLMQSSPTINYNTYGRFPFYVKCDIKCSDNVWRPFKFIIIHTKSTGDSISCAMRVNFCKELKDTLDLYYSSDSLIILGDINDDLDTTICYNSNQSTFKYLVDDSVNYKAVTLPLSKTGMNSFIGYPNMIDHVFISNEMFPYYINNSAKVIKNYTWANTSDHHPVKTQFQIPSAPNILSDIDKLKFLIYPNPVRHYLNIEFPNKYLGEYEIFTIEGCSILKESFNSSFLKIDCNKFISGLYYIKISNNKGEVDVKRFLILERE